MYRVNVTGRDGHAFSVETLADLSIMEAIRSSGQGDIVALCGGMKSCATCHVHVDPPWLDLLDPADEDEEDLLDSSDDRRADSRLSCQIVMRPEMDGLSVRIAAES